MRGVLNRGRVARLSRENENGRERQELESSPNYDGSHFDRTRRTHIRTRRALAALFRPPGQLLVGVSCASFDLDYVLVAKCQVASLVRKEEPN